MTALTLTPTERRALRADAHHLDPVVLVGGDGLTDAVVREVDAALNAHGLIKVRVFADERPVREEVLDALTQRLSAAPVQHIGKLLVLWRPVPERAKAEPEDRKPGPRVVKVLSFSKSGNHRATVRKVRVLGHERITAAGTVKRKQQRQVSQKKKSGG
jgi:putative YhbY family RNA-binding protein